MPKTTNNHHFNDFQNQPQPLHTTITFTTLTNTTILDLPIYFLSPLNIPTSHTSNVLLLRLFDEFTIFTSNVRRLFQYFFFKLFARIFSSFLYRAPNQSIPGSQYRLLLCPSIVCALQNPIKVLANVSKKNLAANALPTITVRASKIDPLNPRQVLAHNY